MLPPLYDSPGERESIYFFPNYACGISPVANRRTMFRTMSTL